jgi:RHS repeat-associated protein
METFVVNETNQDVWFDNFRIQSTTPVIVQETDYDPWGLEHFGTKFQAAGVKVNKYLYNGKELIEDNGLQYYDYGARMYDPAIGRWGVVDPLAEQMRKWSPYSFSFNNPLRFVDLDGMRPLPILGKFKQWVISKEVSWFGKRDTGIPGASTNHKGLDFNYSGGGNTDLGAPILTTHDGTASIKNTTTGGEGRMVVVTSPDAKFRTLYMHLQSINIAEGQKVSESDEIGKMGGSGKGEDLGWTSHLHYEIQILNNETGEYEPYDPTEGKGNKMENIVDPQKWITRSTETETKKQELVKPKEQESRRISEQDLRKMFFLFKILIEKNR